MNENNVTIVGNVTRDPELRYTPSGVAIANFGVAVNKRWQDKVSDEWKEEVSFFDITTWRSLAENVAESCPKGTRVVVTGQLKQRSWESQDGEKRTKVEIDASCVGPSLEWATAEVTRNERPENGNGKGPAREPKPHPEPLDDEPF